MNYKQALISPDLINYKDFVAQDAEGKPYGFTVNPGMVFFDEADFESMRQQDRIRALEFPDFVGKPTYELAQHVADNYSSAYHIPGFEYLQFILDNPDRAPHALKIPGGMFFGSLVKSLIGWGTFRIEWQGSVFDMRMRLLELGWRKSDRVILIEKFDRDLAK